MKKYLLFAIMAGLLCSCNNNEPALENNLTYADGNLTFVYSLSAKDGNIKNTFTKHEWLVVQLDIQNNGEDTMMVNADYLGHLGLCYDSKNQLVESMSAYTYNDTLPVFKPVCHGTNAQFEYPFFVDVPAGFYHYQNPCVVLYTKGKDTDITELTIPLIINFNIQ